MIKQLLSLAAVATMAINANATITENLPATLDAGWSSSWDAATKTITYKDAWAGCGWWLCGTTPADYSDWDEVVIKIQPAEFNVNIVIEYTTGEKDASNNWISSGKSTTATITAGESEGVATLDAEQKDKVMQIYLQAAAAGDLVLDAAYLQSGAEKPSEVVLFEGEQDMANNYYPGLEIAKSKIVAGGAGSTLEIYFTKTGDGVSYKLCTDWTNVVLPSFEDVAGYNPTYNTVWTSQESPIKFTFSADDITTLESSGDSSFRISGGGDGFVITKVVLVYPQASAIRDVFTEVDENAPVEYFNLQGIRVENPENGLYIKRQGNKVTKVLVK